MSTAASLSLLKGGNKAAVEQQLEEAEVPDTAEAADTEVEEEIEIDVDELTSAQLDELVKEHEIAVPDNWSKMKVGQKRQWLKDQFEESSDDEPVEQAMTAQEVPDEIPAADEAIPENTPATVKPETAKVPAKKEAKAAKQEVQSPGDDLIADTIHQIESMKEEEARQALLALTDETELGMFRIGGTLSIIQANQWFAPFPSFKDYVENEAKMHYRKALHLVAIYNSLSESKVPWAKVKNLGWTKLKELAPILTLDNVDEWVAIASESTVLNLIELVRAAQSKDTQIEGKSSPVVTKTFKLHSDQKATVEAALDKAREQANTDADTVALEFICLDFMNSISLVERIKAAGVDKALDALSKAFPEADFAVEFPDATEG